MKKRIAFFIPFAFALLLFFFYLLLYRPPLDLKAPDFITAALVFFGALGWGGVVFFAERKEIESKTPSNIHAALSLLPPILYLWVFRVGGTPQHSFILGLMILGVLMLKGFVIYYKSSLKPKASAKDS